MNYDVLFAIAVYTSAIDASHVYIVGFLRSFRGIAETAAVCRFAGAGGLPLDP